MTNEALKEIIVENCMSTLKWARRLMVEEGQLQYLTMSIMDDGAIMMYSYKGSLDINVYDKLTDDMRADILKAQIESLKDDVAYLTNELKLANQQIDDLESMRSDAIATAEENESLHREIDELKRYGVEVE